MKKTLSFLTLVIALLMIFSFICVNAVAADDLKQHVADAGAQLMAAFEADGVKATDGVQLLRLAKAGQDVKDYAEKLAEAASGNEELTFIQKEINYLALEAAGIEAEEPAFTSDISLEGENPYNICYVLFEKNSISAELADACVSALMGYYVEDEDGNSHGFDYWGFSTDTNGLFIKALLPYRGSLGAVDTAIDKAKAYIDARETDGGYGFSEEYPDANVSSTAAALSAYIALGETQKAFTAYTELLAFESPEKKGGYTYYGEVSLISTSDAFRALLEYDQSGLIPEDAVLPNPSTGVSEVKAAGVLSLCAMIVVAGFAIYRSKVTAK